MTYFDEYEQVEEGNICLMSNHEQSEVNDLTSQSNYFKCFLICKKLNNVSGKLKEDVSVSKVVISSL